MRDPVAELKSLSTFRFQRICELNGLQKHRSDLLNVITLSCLASAIWLNSFKTQVLGLSTLGPAPEPFLRVEALGQGWITRPSCC